MSIGRLRQRKASLVNLLLGVFLVSLGYSQQPPRSGPLKSQEVVPEKSSATSPGKIVLKVGDTQVSAEDFDYVLSKLAPQIQQTVQMQGRRPIAEQYIRMILLSQQALNHHLESLASFRLQWLQMLAQGEYENLARQVEVKPEQVSQYYTTHGAEFEEAQVRQIVIRKRAEGAKEDAPGLPLEEARNRADAIRKAFAAGSDPQKVAQDFKSPNNIQIDTNPRTIRRNQLPADINKVVSQLKEGEVSEPLENPQALVLFQMVGHRRPELKEIKTQIENTLRQEKIEETLADLRKKTPSWMDEEYFAPPSASPPEPTVKRPPDNPPPQP